MISALTLASLLLAGPTNGALICVGPDVVGPVATLQEVYESGRSYTDFLDAAERRAALWHANTEKSEGIDEALVERARAVGGSWKFLAVAVAACSDSVSTIPYLARLVHLVDGLDMRIVDSRVGRSIMESHRTEDGRASTPTVLLLDDQFEEAGCFIERPPALKTWIVEEGFSGDAVYENKMEWYAEDAGHQTIETFVLMLEAAASGTSLCG